MKKDDFLGYKQSLLKPMLTIAFTGALAACGSSDDAPSIPRSIEINDLTATAIEDEAMTSSVNQDLGESVRYSIAGLPENGQVQMNPNGEFEYTPNPDFFGNDSFNYLAIEGDLPSNIATVNIQIQPVNDAPTAMPAELGVFGIDTAAITLQAEDIDSSSLQFTLLSDSSLASISLTSTGDLTYTPNQPFLGQDEIQFSVSDGELSSVATVTVDATPTPIRFSGLSSEFSIQQRSMGEFVVPVQNLSEDDVELNIISAPEWLFGFVGTVPAEGSTDFVVSVDAATLEVGVFSGVVQFIDNNENLISHTIVLQVTSDVLPPASVTSLAVENGELYDAVNLTWTSVRDNNRIDLSAGNYDVRYSTEEISEENWVSAIQVEGEPVASIPDNQEAMQLTGLPESSTLHFAIKVVDPSGNTSELSNVASITTPAAPQPLLDPASANLTISEGNTTGLTVVLRNTGVSPLTYETEVVVAEAPANANNRIIVKRDEVKRNQQEFSAKDIAASNGNIIVKRKSGNRASLVIGNALESKNLKVKKTFQKLNVQVVKSAGKSNAEIAEDINYLNSLPDVIYAEPDYIVHTSAIPNDELFSQQWAVNNEGQTGGVFDADIDAVETWDQYSDGSNVVVAVIDTGVNYNHEDLANNMWTNTGEIPGNGIDDDENGFIDDIHGFDFVNNDGDPIDDHDHGTHCAGIIGAEANNGVGIAGTVHNAQIMAVKFLSAGGSGSSSDAIESIIYAVDNGADVLSNSWGGGGFSQALEDAITYANENNVLFIAAAGNASSNTDLSPNFPSNYDVENVISVASTTHTDGLSSFSNFGLTTVDLGAPGSDILSSVSNGGYQSFSGTSMATPYVAGAAVLIRSNFPVLTALEVKQILMDSVDPIASLDGRTVTGGRLNLDAAMDMAREVAVTLVEITQNASGTVPAGEEVSIPVGINATDMLAGLYENQIIFSVNNPTTPTLTFDLDIEVTPDVEPPAEINDLAVDSSTSTSVTVSWTNTGDDGLVGQAHEVQVAYSLEAITEENWDVADKLTGINPNASGEAQQANFGQLNADTTYFFAAKVLDSSGQSSGLSNLTSTTTLIGPVLSVSSDPIEVVVLSESAELVDLEIGNLGDETLSYSVQVVAEVEPVPAAMANPQAVNYSEEIAKGDNVPQGEPVVTGSGGPDAYGYRWADSDEGGTTYDWQDIAALGTPMTFSDDSVRGPISLGFDFEFYGETYNQVWVSSNGFISFEAPSGTGCCSGRPIPSADGFENIIAWAWADLLPISGYSAHSFAEAGKFTIQFTNYGEFGDSGVVSSQIILNSNGRIKLQYQNVDSDFGLNDASIGIENADGTDGLQVAFNTDYLHDELAVEFFNGLEWVNLSHAVGDLEGGLVDNLGITFDSTGQAAGTYEAELRLLTNDVDQPEVVIPLRMDVVIP